MTSWRRAVRLFRSVVPWPIELRMRKTFWWGTSFRCPVCESFVRKLLPQGYGYPILEELEVVGGMYKPHDTCPVCHANDRVRLVFLYLKEETDVFVGSRSVLHVAPEKGLAGALSRNPRIEYTICDLDRQRYSYLSKDLFDFSIEEIPFEDDRFDYIFCNHVLEHVADDRRSMRELRRVLKPGGQAILQVPISLRLTSTLENVADVNSDADRIRTYGQRDHVRLYGLDYASRLAGEGLRVDKWLAYERLPEKASEFLLDPKEALYVCRK